MRILFLLPAAIALLLGSTTALAYGGSGHALIGAVSDQLLEPGVAQQVQLLLGMDLRTASNWADCVRAVRATDDPRPKFVYEGKELYRASCGVFETPEEQRRMEDYVRRNFTQCIDSRPEHPCHARYHYTDIAIQHARYDRDDLGARRDDLVGAIEASFRVLQGHRAPKPFSIADKREALLLLAHFVGDLHQPLHVGAMFLDATGKPVDPGVQATSAATFGGNALITGIEGANLHVDWDEISALLDPAHPTAELISQARAVALTPGEFSSWPAIWASESVNEARRAFDGLSFTPSATQPGRWVTHASDRRRYDVHIAQTQQQQIIRAGARLAHLVNAAFTPSEKKLAGYLTQSVPLAPWLPVTPETPSITLAADLQAYFQTRRYAGTERAESAGHDDVFRAFHVAARFGATLGQRLDPQTTPVLLDLMDRVAQDTRALIAPVKKDLANGGRPRPLVAFPDEFHCPLKYAPLPTTGAYPSTHAAIGWLWGSILAELAPAKAGELLARGIEFGESRLVCGFHYPSDLAAGRLAAAVLLVHLRQNREFEKDFAAAAKEVARAPGILNSIAGSR